jgi:hypothetical protein
MPATQHEAPSEFSTAVASWENEGGAPGRNERYVYADRASPRVLRSAFFFATISAHMAFLVCDHWKQKFVRAPGRAA